MKAVRINPRYVGPTVAGPALRAIHKYTRFNFNTFFYGIKPVEYIFDRILLFSDTFG